MALVRDETRSGAILHPVPGAAPVVSTPRIVLTLILLLGVTRPSFAAHPLVTDDTGTLGKGKFQLELNGEFRRTREMQGGVFTREDAGESKAAITAGMTDNVDLTLSYPWVYSWIEKNGTVVSDGSGPGDMGLEVKWRFVSRGGYSLAIKPGLTVPTGNEEKGFGNGRVSYAATLIVEKEWERVFVAANAGYARSEFRLGVDRETNRKDIWQTDAAAGFEVAKGVTAVANIAARTNGSKALKQWPTFLLGGFIWSVTDRVDVDVGVKWGLNRSAADFAGLAGITWRF